MNESTVQMEASDYDDYDEYPYVPAKATILQRIGNKTQRALPILPYVPLAIGVHLRSTNWFIVAVFTQLAVTRPKQYVTVSNSHFTSSGGAPGLQIGT